MSFFKGSMQIPDPEKPKDSSGVLTEEEREVFDTFAKLVVRWGLGLPAIMFFESVKPANYIMSQAMVVGAPVADTFLQMFFNYDKYDVIQQALEKRQAPEELILMIEHYDAIAHRREKRIKKYYKAQKKNWKWYQRYLGIMTPRVEYPPEVLNDPPEKVAQISPENPPPPPS